MMKRVLIVGDSFMKPDPAYAGQHFSEMLGSVQTMILSQDGSSMGMILDQIIQGLDHEPDGIIIGFSAQDRVEWPRQDGRTGRWIPSGAVGAMTEQQKELDLSWRTTCDPYMNDIKGYAMASGIMTMLTYLEIPFAWATNLLLLNQRSSYKDTLENMLEPFADRRILADFVKYNGFVEKPTFHVNDLAYQQAFAQRCLSILAF